MLTNLQKVKQFHDCMESKRYDFPATPDVIDLRWRLIMEEYMELFNEFHASTLDKKKMAKEMADLLYVIYGAADILDIPLDEVFDAVHNSNLSKLDDNGKPIKNSYGKIMKGPNYQPPQLEFIFK